MALLFCSYLQPCQAEVSSFSHSYESREVFYHETVRYTFSGEIIRAIVRSYGISTQQI